MSESNSQKNTENSHVRPPFPPVITAQDLIPTDVSNKVETVRIPNAFIAYRMALVRELKSKKVACHRSNVSSLASRLWAEEPEDVKNTYRKMATDAQMMHNQARGLTFLSYEQSTSTDNVMQDEPNPEINNHPHSLSAQEIETELLALFNLQNLQIQTPLQQENLLPSPISSPMFTSASSIASPYDQFSNNPGNPLNGNFLGNMTGKGMYDAGRGLEHRIQILEQQISLFYQLWFGIYGMV